MTRKTKRPMRSPLAAAIVAVWLLFVGSVVTASAQTGASDGRFEVAGMVAWTTESQLGSRAATLTRNSTTDTTPFTLFSTSGRLEPAPAIVASFGYRVTDWLTAEATGRIRRPTVEIAVSGDTEAAPGTAIASERLDEYSVDASAVIALPLRFGERGQPFVMGGFGYRRELHDDRADIDTGTSVHGGGGVKWIVSSRNQGWLRRLGIRGEVRIVQRRGGFRLNGASDVSASAGGGVFFVF